MTSIARKTSAAGRIATSSPYSTRFWLDRFGQVRYTPKYCNRALVPMYPADKQHRDQGHWAEQPEDVLDPVDQARPPDGLMWTQPFSGSGSCRAAVPSPTSVQVASTVAGCWGIGAVSQYWHTRCVSADRLQVSVTTPAF
jgi:hypothetical protein